MKQTYRAHIVADLTKRVVIAHVFVLVIIAVVMIFANNILKERSARQAVSFIKHLIIKNEMREVIHTLSMAEMQDFSGVIYFSDIGARVFSLPADLSDDLINKKNPILALAYTSLDIPVYFGTDESQKKLALVRFIYPRFSLFPYALGLWFFALLLTLPIVLSTKKRLTLHSEKELRAKTDAYKAEIAAKVRHDIRSPLASFKTLLRESSEKINLELVSHAAERIEEIISELQIEEKEVNAQIPTNISQSVARIITEKQAYILGHAPKVTLTCV